MAGGYTYCACRDCFDIAIGEDPVLCGLCQEAGCEGETECQRPDAYDAETDEADE